MAFTDKYSWGGRLGAGAFGEVRMARCRETGMELAVKTVHAGDPQQCRVWPLSLFEKRRKPTPLRKIEREADVWKHVGQHSNIVYLVDVCPFTAGVHFVMERCGASLEESMPEVRRKGLASLRQISHELLSALEHVHSRSVIHRDVKPANLLLMDGSRSTLKLCDFGSAVTVLSSGKHVGMGGSPHYVPPETLRTGIFTAKADIWAAGSTLYKLLYGSHPYTCSKDHGDIPANVESGRMRPKYNPTADCAGGAWLRGDASLQSAELVQALLQRDANLRADATFALALDFAKVDFAMLTTPEDQSRGESQPAPASSAVLLHSQENGQWPRGLRCCVPWDQPDGKATATPSPSQDAKAEKMEEDTQEPTSGVYSFTEGSKSLIGK